MPGKTYLLSGGKRSRIPPLDPRIPKHLHHLAEVGRRKELVRQWFNREKARLGHERTEEINLTSEAKGNPALARLFDRRDARIVSEILKIAGINKAKHKNVLRVVRETQILHTLESVEVHVFFRYFFEALSEKQVLKPKGLAALRAACGDWVQVRRFVEPLTKFIA